MKIVNFIVILLISVLFVAGEDVGIVLDSYEPRPVIPGEEFSALFVVRNNDVVNGSLDVEVFVDDTHAFSVQGNNRKTITFTDIGEKIVGFTLLVDEDIISKTEELDVEICVDDECQEETFIIRVKQDISLIINSIKTLDNFELGKEGIVQVGLINDGDSVLENVNINLDLSSQEVPFSFLDGGSDLVISRINTGESKEVFFAVRADTIAESGTYKVPLIVTYSDASGEEFVLDDFVSLKIFSMPDIFFSFDKNDLVISRDNIINLKVVNKGLGDAMFLSVKILESSEYDIIKNGDIYVGDLDSNDFDAIDFTILPSKKEIVIPVYLEYRDEENKLYTQTISLYPVVYTLDEAKDLGLVENGKGWIFVIIALIVIGFLVYRRKKKKR